MAVEAILLVGGRGTRLRPLTLDTPKPMLPTAGVPFLAHQLARLRSAGVRRVVLATSYREETFRRRFGDGSAFGVELSYAFEGEPLGTGGALRNAAGRLSSEPDEPVLALNGDVLSDHDLGAQVALHRGAGAAVTLHLTEVADARSFGCVPTDADGRITAFHEKSQAPATNRVNAGCYVFDRRVISSVPANRAVSLENETFPGLLSAGRTLMGYVESSYWLDVGTPCAYVQGSCDLVRGRLRSAALPGPPGSALVLGEVDVASDAAVGGGTALGDGSLVGSGAELSGSVVFGGAAVGDDAAVRDSVLADGVRVGEGAVLEGVVAGAGAVIGPRNELRDGLRVWPGVELPSGAVRFSSDA